MDCPTGTVEVSGAAGPSCAADAPYGSVVTDGQPAPELAEIFQIIADNDLVLATGHSSPEEVLLLLPEARRRGVRNILNHPRVGAESDAGSSGAHGESGGDHGTRLSWRSPIHESRITWRSSRPLARNTFLISSDLGQYLNPLHTDGLKAFVTELREQGISEGDIDMMARRNPARLLGLDP